MECVGDTLGSRDGARPKRDEYHGYAYLAIERYVDAGIASGPFIPYALMVENLGGQVEKRLETTRFWRVAQ